MVETGIELSQNELYSRMSNDLGQMLENASAIGDLVLAAHLQSVKDLVDEQIAFRKINRVRI
jgi:hypothetical protein